MLHMSPEERRECERRNRKDAEAFLALRRRMGDISLKETPQPATNSIRQSLETSRALGNILVNYALFNTTQPTAVMEAGAAWMKPSTPASTETVFSGAPQIEMYTAEESLAMRQQGNRDLEILAEYEAEFAGEYGETSGLDSFLGDTGYGMDGGFAGGAEAGGDAGGGSDE